MKTSFFPYLYIVGFLGLVIGCADKITNPEVQYVQVVDSTRIIQLEQELQKTKDSLNVYKSDTLMSSDEFILRYKLERIRYYNDIAKNGNNIKYLRGWINRVLEE